MKIEKSSIRKVEGIEVGIKKLLTTSDGIKENLKEVIERLKEYGLKVYMFIGDKKEVANYIGKSLNIDEIKYEMLPTDKYDNYEYVSNKDGLTIFVGDGVNDALY